MIHKVGKVWHTVWLVSFVLLLSVSCADATETDAVEFARLSNEACASYHQGKYKEGLKKIERAIRLDPQNLSGLTIKGMLLSAANRYEEADAILRAVIARDPGFSDAHLWLALNLLNRQHAQQSLAEMRIYQAQRGTDACFDHLAAILIMANRCPEAIELCHQHLKKHPESVSALSLEATALAQQRKWTQSLAILESIRSRSEDNVGFHEIRAYCLSQMNQVILAKAELKKALSVDSAAARILISNRIKAMRAVNDRAPLAVYEAVYEVPLSPDEKKQRDLNWKLQSGNPEAVIAVMQNKVKANTAQSDDYRVLGKLLWRSHRPSESILAYDKLITLCPQDYDAVFERGHIYYELLMDREAIRDLSRAIELKPDSREPYRLRALCLKRQGRASGTSESRKASNSDKE
ncbi:MAG: tetratricopeptide repeat protein [Cyanobacteria bacterium]|nr:tetratricopeptide repeat protein [Cyanobacteriota bacterium]